MPPSKKTDTSSPFSALKGLKEKLVQEQHEKERRLAEEKRPAKTKNTPPSSPENDASLFAAAMKGVKPLEPEAVRLPRKQDKVGAIVESKPSGLSQDDEEVLEELQGMVEGAIPLDYTFSDEFVEGRASDCSRLDLAKLRKGEFAVQAYFDLHGKNRDEAKVEIAQFFKESMSKNLRCVLVISGRGLRSPGGRPILKELLVRWLVAGPLSRCVLAFSTALPHDGGLGALYVLLRRKPK
ncbi:MAG: Smr/MutS family protein [Bdellovibrionota bacterium]